MTNIKYKLNLKEETVDIYESFSVCSYDCVWQGQSVCV